MSNATPDLIFVMCDQLRADFLPAYGCRAFTTPHIDRLAREGTVFDNALSPYPLCVPARAALLSGLNPLQSGVTSNRIWLRPDRGALGLRTWPDLLRDRGYRTAAIGKMHFYPWDAAEGFDDRIIAEDKRWPLIADDYAEFLAAQGRTKFDPLRTREYQDGKGAVLFPWGAELSPDRFVADQAAAYIRRQPAGRPLALMVGFPGPHCPYDPSPDYLDQVDPSALPAICPRVSGTDARRRFHADFVAGHRLSWCNLDYAEFSLAAKQRLRHHYAALVKQIDDELGKILAALEATGRMDRALVVFTSDHGDEIGDHDRVGKATFYEPSIHIPLIVRRPGGAGAGGRLVAPVQLQQVPPTLLQAAGVAPPPWWDFAALPGDPAARPKPAAICGVLDIGCMIRRGAWKLSRYTAGFSELFNLEEDPAEGRDRSDDPACAGVRAELERELLDWAIASAQSGHVEQRLDFRAGGHVSPEFGRRGWTRTYPVPRASGLAS